ncbi:diguanylate cyclase [Pelagerythrobacter sp.]|uniref:GGDEF domain-containing protein n=1 Tax=Pelagerythrobacter sp. TaxID=2800702 RepID=UPI0035B111D4
MRNRLEALIIPDLPPEIRDDFLVNAACELQRQAPWLLAAMTINSIIAMLTASPNVGWFVQYGLPGAMALYSLLSIVSLRRNLHFAEKPRRAANFLVQSTVSSWFGALICTSWCVLSWLNSPVDARMHFPIILIVGALASAYCLSNVKVGAMVTLALDMLPIAALMILFGNAVEMAAAISLLLAGGFQLRMVDSHNARMVNLHRLRHDAQRQARTDALTGLSNRRALLDEAQAMGRDGAALRLMLIDLDHFKAINDRHGHDMGDDVLRAIGALLRRHDGGPAAVARIGGEEFAIVGPADELPAGLPLSILAEISGHPMPHGRPVTASIGVADGPAFADEHWRALFARADAALYTAKSAGRNRMAEAPEAAASQAASPRAIAA